MMIENDPLEDLAREQTIGSLDGIRECLISEKIYSADYRYFKNNFINGMSYLEAKAFMKDREKQPVHDTHIPIQEQS